MKNITLLLLVSMLTLTACAPKKYIAIISPKKTEQETKAATTYAESIFAVYHEQGMEYFRQEIARPEVLELLKNKVASKIDDSSLGACLNNYGFSNYLTERMLEDVTPEKLHKQIISNWVMQFPNDQLAKVDSTMNNTTFKKIFRRMREMDGGNIRSKLKDLRDKDFITDAEANEFILMTEDKEIKTFMIIADHDVKASINKLLATYIQNPSSTILEFMKTHPEANNKCSFLKGHSL